MHYFAYYYAFVDPLDGKKKKKKTGLPLIRLTPDGAIVSVTVYRLPIRLPAKSALTWPVV